MAKISIVSAFEFSNQGQKDLDSVASTFSVLDTLIENVNQSGSEFISTLKNLNADSSTFQKNIESTIENGPVLTFSIVSDDEQLQKNLEEIKNTRIPIVAGPLNLSGFVEDLEERGQSLDIAQGLDTIFSGILFVVENFWDQINIAFQNPQLINVLVLLGSIIAVEIAAAFSTFAALSVPKILLVLALLATSLYLVLGGADDLKRGIETLSNSFNSVLSFITPTEEEAQKLAETLKNVEENAPDLEEIIPEGEFELNLELGPLDPQRQQEIQEEIDNTSGAIQNQSNNLDILDGAIAMVGNGYVAGAGAQSQFAINQREVTESVKEGEEALVNGAEGAMQFAAETANASATLDALGVFAADIAANINDSFADLIFNGLKGNINSLSDLWEDTLDTMLEAISQFAATVISNPIRIVLEGALSGNFGGGGGGGGASIFGGLGNSFKALGGVFGIGGGLTELAPAAGLPVGVGALVPTSVGFFGNLTSAIPAIGAIIAAVTTLVSVLLDVFKKTPRLDLDFDQLRDDAGKSLGIAAEVADFLDSEVFNNEIFNRSVSRQAGLGLGSDLPNVIREAIEGQIEQIQDIINRLPFELATQLNEALLSTPVDIESQIKGDRLLEFDETKQEKSQNVIKMTNYREKNRQNDEFLREVRLAA